MIFTLGFLALIFLLIYAVFAYENSLDVPSHDPTPLEIKTLSIKRNIQQEINKLQPPQEKFDYGTRISSRHFS